MSFPAPAKPKFNPNAPSFTPGAAGFAPRPNPNFNPSATTFNPSAASFNPSAALFNPSAPSFNPSASFGSSLPDREGFTAGLAGSTSSLTTSFSDVGSFIRPNGSLAMSASGLSGIARDAGSSAHSSPVTYPAALPQGSPSLARLDLNNGYQPHGFPFQAASPISPMTTTNPMRPIIPFKSSLHASTPSFHPTGQFPHIMSGHPTNPPGHQQRRASVSFVPGMFTGFPNRQPQKVPWIAVRGKKVTVRFPEEDDIPSDHLQERKRFPYDRNPLDEMSKRRKISQMDEDGLTGELIVISRSMHWEEEKGGFPATVDIFLPGMDEWDYLRDDYDPDWRKPASPARPKFALFTSSDRPSPHQRTSSLFNLLPPRLQSAYDARTQSGHRPAMSLALNRNFSLPIPGLKPWNLGFGSRAVSPSAVSDTGPILSPLSGGLGVAETPAISRSEGSSPIPGMLGLPISPSRSNSGSPEPFKDKLTMAELGRGFGMVLEEEEEEQAGLEVDEREETDLIVEEPEVAPTENEIVADNSIMEEKTDIASVSDELEEPTMGSVEPEQEAQEAAPEIEAQEVEVDGVRRKIEDDMVTNPSEEGSDAEEVRRSRHVALASIDTEALGGFTHRRKTTAGVSQDLSAGRRNSSIYSYDSTRDDLPTQSLSNGRTDMEMEEPSEFEYSNPSDEERAKLDTALRMHRHRVSQGQEVNGWRQSQVLFDASNSVELNDSQNSLPFNTLSRSPSYSRPLPVPPTQPQSPGFPPFNTQTISKKLNPLAFDFKPQAGADTESAAKEEHKRQSISSMLGVDDATPVAPQKTFISSGKDNVRAFKFPPAEEAANDPSASNLSTSNQSSNLSASTKSQTLSKSSRPFSLNPTVALSADGRVVGFGTLGRRAPIPKFEETFSAPVETEASEYNLEKGDEGAEGDIEEMASPTPSNFHDSDEEEDQASDDSSASESPLEILERIIHDEFESVRQELAGFTSLKAELDSLKQDAMVDSWAARMEEVLYESKVNDRSAVVLLKDEIGDWKHDIQKKLIALLEVASIPPAATVQIGDISSVLERSLQTLENSIKESISTMSLGGDYWERFDEKTATGIQDTQTAVVRVDNGLRGVMEAQTVVADTVSEVLNSQMALGSLVTAKFEELLAQIRKDSYSKEVEGNLQHQISELENALARSRNDNARVQNEKELAITQVNRLEAENKALQARLAELETKTLVEHQITIGRLEQQLQASQIQHSQSQELASSLQSQAQDWIRKEAELENAAGQAQIRFENAEERLGEKIEEVAGLRIEVEEMRHKMGAERELSAARQGELIALEKRLTTQDEKLSNLQKGAAKGQQSLAQANQKISELERKLSYTENEHASTQSKLLASQSQLSQTEATLTKMQEDDKIFRGRISAELSSTREAIQRELDQAHATIESERSKSKTLAHENEQLKRVLLTDTVHGNPNEPLDQWDTDLFAQTKAMGMGMDLDSSTFYPPVFMLPPEDDEGGAENASIHSSRTVSFEEVPRYRVDVAVDEDGWWS